MIRPLALLLLIAAPALADRAPPSTPSGMTEAERGAFALSVGKCWNQAALTDGARGVSVTVALRIDADRRPVTETLRLVSHNPASAPGDDVAAAYDAARRAILRCGSPGFDLPAHKRAAWSATEITFPGGVFR